jgi:hypothetical protein
MPDRHHHPKLVNSSLGRRTGAARAFGSAQGERLQDRAGYGERSSKDIAGIRRRYHEGVRRQHRQRPTGLKRGAHRQRMIGESTGGLIASISVQRGPCFETVQFERSSCD